MPSLPSLLVQPPPLGAVVRIRLWDKVGVALDRRIAQQAPTNLGAVVRRVIVEGLFKIWRVLEWNPVVIHGGPSPADFACDTVRLMPISQEVRKLLHGKLNAADERMRRECEEKRRNARRELAARGMLQSGAAITAQAEVLKRWIEQRVKTHADVYLDTLAALEIPIDSAIESEIHKELAAISQWHGSLASLSPLAPHAAALVGVKGELESAGHTALCDAQHRITEARLKAERPMSATPPTPSSITNNYIANGPNSRVNLNSHDASTNLIVHEAEHAIEELIKLSASNAELAAAALELKKAWPDKKSFAESVSKWVQLAGASATVMQQALPWLHHLYEALRG